MPFLLIETSGNDSFVALCERAEILTAQPLPGTRQASALSSTVRDLLKKEEISLGDLAFIAVGIGPGSFTGTRVGAMMAKTLGFARQIPLFPFWSPQRFFPPHPGPFITLLDAKANGVWALEGSKEGAQTHFPSPPILLDEGTLLNTLKGVPLILSPHTEKIQMRLPDIFREKKWISPHCNPALLAQMIDANFHPKKAHSHAEIAIAYLHDPKSS